MKTTKTTGSPSKAREANILLKTLIAFKKGNSLVKSVGKPDARKELTPQEAEGSALSGPYATLEEARRKFERPYPRPGWTL